jgi:hypothetical protein
MSWLGSRKLRAGDLVEVRSAEEIAATLGPDGTLDALPFMPEMLRHCGQRIRVFKRSHKTCDTIHKTGNRRMDRTVHLEGLRCDGSAHGGCQAGCLLFWKEEWLRPVSSADPSANAPPAPDLASRLAAATRRAPEPGSGAPAYRCQATELFAATRPIRRFDLLHYLEDLTSANVGLREFVRVSLIALFNFLQGLRGGGGLPRFSGGRLAGKTPKLSLGLQAGDLVEVRSAEEIAETLDTSGRNRGLWFDLEMVPSCGSRFRVARRVERLIDERSGRMVEMKNDCVVLDGVTCRAHYSKKRLFCPRAITPYWREIWLCKIESAESDRRRGGDPQ